MNLLQVECINILLLYYLDVSRVNISIEICKIAIQHASVVDYCFNQGYFYHSRWCCVRLVCSVHVGPVGLYTKVIVCSQEIRPVTHALYSLQSPVTFDPFLFVIIAGVQNYHYMLQISGTVTSRPFLGLPSAR